MLDYGYELYTPADPFYEPHPELKDRTNDEGEADRCAEAYGEYRMLAWYLIMEGYGL